MPKFERIREVLSVPPTPEYLRQRAEAGWKLVALIWEREIDGEPVRPTEEDVPYGVRIAGDCSSLEDDPGEQEVLMLAMELIVQDRPLSQIAAELNRHGHRTRQGVKWTPGAVFDLLPRLIQVGPRMFSSAEWPDRRRHFLNIT